MMAKPLTEAISQLRAARDVVLSEIAALDLKISRLHGQRNLLTNGTVSRDEFVAYLRADLKRRGARFALATKRGIASTQKDYAHLKRADDAGNNVSGVQFLTGDPMIPVDVSDGAMYFYFGDFIADRISTLIESEPWPDSAATVGERVKLIASYDAEIAQLSTERDALASQLIDLGLVS